ncbi:Oxoglutarate/iron-dependent dioxygenase [Cynara cardunculus var. scolymus]|uniref:Oxoglutarate/iron-dependent dioxygenase n=1 Tax=Cynara cardunculus var. scolymus TaxID=59895 RepID=A0A103XMK0_CYNCS|nr:Oxoglutarate/iron-dependent dioxygenase [Cynara cardunculus var. scolymus]
MMNGISSGIKMSKAAAEEEETTVKGVWLSILKGLEPAEIEEVFSQKFCHHCQPLLQSRLQSVANRKRMKKLSTSSPGSPDNIPERCLESSTDSFLESSSKNGSIRTPQNTDSRTRMRYADKFSPASVDSKNSASSTESKSGRLFDEGICGLSSVEDLGFANVGRKNNFVHIERINEKNVNVLQGLELHTRVFNAEEQKKIVKSVYEFQRMGQRGRFREKTYSEPAKWMRGKGRVTIQFGCCYNYAIDKHGNPPGILRNEEVDPLPPIFKQMIKRMVRWHVLPPTCVPNSCIVNIYDEGDCIPPHIDHHDFLRPFCTISFLTECNILFGSSLKIVGPGEFAGPVSIPLPTGISITFRRMDESKIPYGYSPDPELQGLEPLVLTPSRKPVSQQKQIVTKEVSPPASKPNGGPCFVIGGGDFPPLGVGNASQQRGHKKNVFKS